MEDSFMARVEVVSSLLVAVLQSLIQILCSFLVSRMVLSLKAGRVGHRRLPSKVRNMGPRHDLGFDITHVV